MPSAPITTSAVAVVPSAKPAVARPASWRKSLHRQRLVITPKTAGNHVEHIYAKIGATSRTAAAMFAVQHGLLPEEKAAIITQR
jgi:hypothetical protein